MTDMYEGGKVYYKSEGKGYDYARFDTFKDACKCARLMATVAGYKNVFVVTYNGYYDMFEDFDFDQVEQWFNHWFPEETEH